MLSRIRDVRRAKGLTLAEVAARCKPPTTAQTIGRLETGTRTLSIGWLNRIAAGLGVDSGELVQLPHQQLIPVAAVLTHDGAQALTHESALPAPAIGAGLVALRIEAGIGDYRAGDEVWLEKTGPDGYPAALNRDVLIPRPAGRFHFGRLIGRDADRLLILPLGAGGRQQVVTDPPWIGVATRLIRTL